MMGAAKRLVQAGQGEQAVAATLVETIASQFEAERVCFCAGGHPAPLVLDHARGLSDAAMSRLRGVLLADLTLVGRAVETGTFQAVDTRASGDDFQDVRAIEANGVAWAQPLVSRDRTLGVVLGVRAEPLAAEEREVLGDLAAIAAVSMTRRPESVEGAGVALEGAISTIANSLMILPAAHMRAAVFRGFQLWPSAPDATLPDFLHNVLRVIVRQARLTAGAEMAALGVGDSPDRPFDPWVFDGVPPELEQRMGRHPRPVGTLGVVARGGVVVRVAQAKDHPAFAGLPPEHPEVRSLLGVPILYGSQSLGNLYLANKIDAREFSEDDERAIEMLATYAALALQQTYLRAAVEAHQAHLHSILESAPHAILFIDARTGRVITNPRATTLLGESFPPERGREAYARLLRRSDGRPIAIDELLSTRALRGEQPEPTELLVVRRDGKEIPVIESAAPVLGFENRVLGAVVNFEEISSFKELERLREEFAAMIVHDLRGPVQAILMQTNLLARSAGQEAAELNRGLTRIEKSARRLARMASDLLDTTRIELQRLSLTRETIPLERAVEQAIEHIAPAMGSHEVRWTRPSTSSDVSIDAGRFEQVMFNLLDNAAKFSPPSAPIDVRVTSGAGAQGGCMVAIEDHGEGMDPEVLGHVFDRFYQPRRARERGTGLGLGLYISKGLVEAQGGRIWATSTVGEGTTVCVWFPLAG